MIEIKNVIMMVVSLLVVALMLPQGIGYIAHMGDTMIVINGTTHLLKTIIDPSVLTILQVVIPIVVAIGIMLAFLPSIRSD